MKKALSFSLRNLTRQKRRNVILAIAIAFGFFVVTLVAGLVSGMVGNLESLLTHLVGGSVAVQGYEKIPPAEEGGTERLVNSLDKDYLLNLVDDLNIDYEYYTLYTGAGVQLIFEGKRSSVTLYGYDLKESHFVENIQIVEGSAENFERPDSLIISDLMASSLNLQVGDDVLISVTTVNGQPNVGEFRVGAIIRANSLVGGYMTYTNIEYLNGLLELPADGYDVFALFLRDNSQQERVAQRIENRIRADGNNVTSIADAKRTNPGNVGRGLMKQLERGEDETYQWDGVKYQVSTVYYEVPQLQTIVSTVNLVSTAILVVILLIVMVGVSNTYRMILYERIREIGTMRALGMSRKDTSKIFTSEAVALCLIGAAAGFVLSLVVMAIVHLIPVSNETLSLFLDDGRFTFKISAASVILQYLILILLTTIAVRGSAKKAAAMSPAEALRTVK